MGSNCDVMETFGHSARFVISCNKMFLFNAAGFLVFFPLLRGELHCTCHLTGEFHPSQSSLWWCRFAGCSHLKIQRGEARREVFTFQCWRLRMKIGGGGNGTRARGPNVKLNPK